MSTVDRMPDQVAASCFSFLSTRRHSACAQVCTRFRRLAILAVGFPDAVHIRNTRLQSLAQASPALARMRPRKLLHIAMSPYDVAAGECPPATFGRLGRLLRGQSQCRRLRLTRAACLGAGSPTALAEELRLESASATTSVGADCADPSDDDSDDDDSDGFGNAEAEEEKGEGGAPQDPRILTACRELDLEVAPRPGDVDLDQLLRLVPNLTRLACRWFHQPEFRVLTHRLPRLEQLRIDKSVDPDYGGNTVYGFAGTLLACFPALKRLVLPQETVFHDELNVAADRLERLEVDAIFVHAAAAAAGGDRRYPKMARLAHLVARVSRKETGVIVERTPALRSGRLEIASRAVHGLHSRMVAQLAGGGRVDWSYVPAQRGKLDMSDHEWQLGSFVNHLEFVAKLGGGGGGVGDHEDGPDARNNGGDSGGGGGGGGVEHHFDASVPEILRLRIVAITAAGKKTAVSAPSTTIIS